jgi:hypothetical protein
MIRYITCIPHIAKFHIDIFIFHFDHVIGVKWLKFAKSLLFTWHTLYALDFQEFSIFFDWVHKRLYRIWQLPFLLLFRLFKVRIPKWLRGTASTAFHLGTKLILPFKLLYLFRKFIDNLLRFSDFYFIIFRLFLLVLATLNFLFEFFLFFAIFFLLVFELFII